MKALVKAQGASPGIWMEDIPEPEVGPNDVLIKIRKTAICGTDMHIYNWDQWAQKTIPVPMAVGHEYVGEIVEMGSEVQRLQARRPRLRRGPHHLRLLPQLPRRAPPPLPQHGGRRRQPPGLLRRVPGDPGVQRVQAAATTSPTTSPSILDPLGNATHTALSFNLVGEDVLITGAGPIGIMAAAIARHVGARHVVITDVNDYRLELARKMGATRAVNVEPRHARPDVMKDLGMTEGFDVGLEMSGNPSAFRDMLRTMNHGGSVALLGIPPDDTAIDWNQVIFKGLVIKGIYGREMFETWYKMVGHAAERPRHHADHHPPLPDRGFPRRLRDHAQRPVGQGHPRLGGLRIGTCDQSPLAAAWSMFALPDALIPERSFHHAHTYSRSLMDRQPARRPR